MSEGGPAPSASSDLLRLEHAPETARKHFFFIFPPTITTVTFHLRIFPTANPFVVQPVRKTQKVPISPRL